MPRKRCRQLGARRPDFKAFRPNYPITHAQPEDGSSRIMHRFPNLRTRPSRSCGRIQASHAWTMSAAAAAAVPGGSAKRVSAAKEKLAEDVAAVAPVVQRIHEAATRHRQQCLERRAAVAGAGPPSATFHFPSLGQQPACNRSGLLSRAQPEPGSAASWRPPSEAFSMSSAVPSTSVPSTSIPSTSGATAESSATSSSLNAASPILCVPLEDPALPLARATHLWLPAEEQWRQLKPPRKRKRPVERPASGTAGGAGTASGAGGVDGVDAAGLPVGRRGPVPDELPPGWTCEQHPNPP